MTMLTLLIPMPIQIPAMKMAIMPVKMASEARSLETMVELSMLVILMVFSFAVSVVSEPRLHNL